MAEQASSQKDESMEEILHSIRDIIAEDGKDDAPKAADAGEDEEILDLTEVVEKEPEADKKSVVEETPLVIEQPVAAEPAAEAPKENDILSDIDEALDVKPQNEVPEQPQTLEESVMAEEPKATEPATAANNTADGLISQEKAKASTAAIKNLVDNIPKPKVESKQFRNGSTVEDLVVESMKPMLSQWLDKNLQTIVEELVQKEIKKLIPRD